MWRSVNLQTGEVNIDNNNWCRILAIFGDEWACCFLLQTTRILGWQGWPAFDNDFPVFKSEDDQVVPGRWVASCRGPFLLGKPKTRRLEEELHHVVGKIEKVTSSTNQTLEGQGWTWIDMGCYEQTCLIFIVHTDAHFFSYMNRAWFVYIIYVYTFDAAGSTFGWNVFHVGVICQPRMRKYII